MSTEAAFDQKAYNRSYERDNLKQIKFALNRKTEA